MVQVFNLLKFNNCIYAGEPMPTNLGMIMNYLRARSVIMSIVTSILKSISKKVIIT